MLFREINPARDRHLAQRADVAFDEIQSEQTEWPDEGPCVKACFELAKQGHKLIEHPDARTARVDKARDALVDADQVRIRETQRTVGMHV